MKIRRLLATFVACWIGTAAAQYGYPPMMPPPMPHVYTALWWNPSESGWGLNTTHQGSTMFATLFTYAPDGQPLWLVASNLMEMSMGMDMGMMASGSMFTGTLYHTHGPPFSQVPWSPIGFDQVGTMTISWDSDDNGLLSYTYNGTIVEKFIQRQVFAQPVPDCFMTANSRMGEPNYQDLWWNPNESGWGMNLVHQGNIMFATLFTYSESGRDKWFVASSLPRQADGSYSGALYSTTGPAFNASPWQPIGFSQVGNMAITFTDGEHGTLTYSVGTANVTKAIQRQVFSNITSACRE